MDIKFIPVTTAADERMGRLLKLYSGSFPFEERRSESQLKEMIGHEKMSLIAIQAGDQLAGFLVWWNFTDFAYIEHFAIFPELRGSQIGSAALQRFSIKAPKTLLEAEKPNDETSERRMVFYRRNGFEVVDTNYLQPPYREGGTPVSMDLLSDFLHWNVNELETAVQLIHAEVYSRHRL